MVDTSAIARFGSGAFDMAPLSLAAPLDEDEARRLVEATTNEGVIVQDALGQVVWHNPASTRLLGLTDELLNGDAALDPTRGTVHRDGTPLTRDESPAIVALRTGLPVRNRIIGVPGPQADTVWLSMSSRPAQRANRPHAVTVFSDVTEELSRRREVEDVMLQIGDGLFPTDLPNTERVHVAGRARPAAESSQLGGDFCGAQRLGPDRCLFFIGNITGQTTHAACVSSLARHTLRSAGMLLDDPAVVLHHLHDAVGDEWPDTTLTAVFGYVEFSEKSATFRISCGGHALPVLIGANGAREVGTSGAAIGSTEGEPRRSMCFEARSGEQLLLYTGELIGRDGSSTVPSEFFAGLEPSIPVSQFADAAYELAAGGEQEAWAGAASVLAINVL